MKSIIILISLLFSLSSFADIRVCGEPKRDSSGDIIRSSNPNWAKDHVIPLACGGCDSIENLQWLPNEMKSAAGKYPKDRWERKINCKPMTIVP